MWVNVRLMHSFPHLSQRCSIRVIDQVFTSRPFPRRNCRGLIEAGINRRGIFSRAGHFRGVTAAASLKQCPASSAQSGFSDFRGVTAAASLKLVKTAASILVQHGAFPRRNCRGLIEARSCGASPAPITPYFRGVTAAASLKLGRSTRVSSLNIGDFRGVTAAASLKLELLWHHAGERHQFPRRNCRGLIETRCSPSLKLCRLCTAISVPARSVRWRANGPAAT
jgi:hypothetical protein